MKESLAAVAPVCGGLHGVQDFQNLIGIPIWTAHNTGDDRVDYEESADAVGKIEKLANRAFYQTDQAKLNDSEITGHDLIFTSFNKEGHDAWTDLYSSDALYLWFLRHRLN